MQRLGLRALEDAAESLGSSGWQRFCTSSLPALRHSILAGLIIVAALSIGEFQFSNLVAGFLNRTYPVVLLQAFYGATGFACAATVDPARCWRSPRRSVVAAARVGAAARADADRARFGAA